MQSLSLILNFENEEFSKSMVMFELDFVWPTNNKLSVETTLSFTTCPLKYTLSNSTDVLVIVCIYPFR